MLSDLRYAIRQLAKSPGFTAVALLTLALGIGVNTSMFSALRTLVLRTLPYADADRLVRVHRTGPNFDARPHSPANFLDLRAQNSVVDHMTAVEWAGFSFTEDERPAEWLQGMRVTADFFPLLGRAPALGRVFTSEDDQPGRNNVLVLSHAYWVSRFARDPDIVGRQLRLNGETVTVIGVMPPGFEEPLLWGSIVAWRPIAFTPAAKAERGNHSLTVIARLKPGVSLAQAEAGLNLVAAQLATAYPATNAKTGVRLALLSRGSIADDNGQITFFVAGLALFVLLIACANLANLQFARTASRARELAVRAALGASRTRLMRQVLTESLLLALAGGLLGVLVALWCNGALASRFDFGEAGLEFPLDAHGLAFAFFISAATGIAFGLLPAWLASRTDVNAALQQSPRGATSAPGQHRVRQALIVAEVALALVLLASAAFFLGGLKRFMHRDVGWSAEGLLSGYITLAPPAGADTPELRAVYRRNLVEQIETRLAAVPGVDGVAFTRAVPTWGYSGNTPFAVEGQPPAEPGRAPSATVDAVTPAFFDLFRIRLLQGRTFTAADRADAPPIIVINETMARTFWPGKNPIGQRLGSTNPAQPDWREVVGVVADTGSVNDLNAAGSRFQTFRPWTQAPEGGGMIVLRSRMNPTALAPALRAVVAEVAPDLPVRGIATVRADIDRSLANLELAGWTLTAFALLGLLLAAIGIYGVLAHHVQQRTNEIGIRLALGAQVRDVLVLVLGQGLRLTLIGAGLGLAGAFAVGRLLASIMPGLPAENLLTAAAVTALLVAVALLACWLPARRATKVDPMIALRAE